MVGIYTCIRIYISEPHLPMLQTALMWETYMLWGGGGGGGPPKDKSCSAHPLIIRESTAKYVTLAMGTFCTHTLYVRSHFCCISMHILYMYMFGCFSTSVTVSCYSGSSAAGCKVCAEDYPYWSVSVMGTQYHISWQKCPTLNRSSTTYVHILVTLIPLHFSNGVRTASVFLNRWSLFHNRLLYWAHV